MKFSRGFTLIEVLVVIVVIALLVSISALNSDSDPRADILKTEATRIKFYLESATDEAILNSKTLALNFIEKKISPYSWGKKPQSTDNESQDPISQKDEWEWTTYKGQNLIQFQSSNDTEYQLFINDKEVILDFEEPQEKAITPQVIIQSSGIQTLAEIKLSLPDYESSISIKSNGAGRFKIGEPNNEI